MSDLYKPGTDNLPAGEYREVENDGSYIENGRLVNIDPVSYTHLDVYKRQVFI